MNIELADLATCDGQTDGRADFWMDKPAYGDAWTNLRIEKAFAFDFVMINGINVISITVVISKAHLGPKSVIHFSTGNFFIVIIVFFVVVVVVICCC